MQEIGEVRKGTQRCCDSWAELQVPSLSLIDWEHERARPSSTSRFATMVPISQPLAAEPAAGAQHHASGIVAAVVIWPCLVPWYRVNNFGMQIGELARAAGVNIQTIRFYEREKLLPAPARTASGYRDYQRRDLERILFIRRNHEIGFTLIEIRQLLDLHGALETMPRPLRRKPAQVKEIIAIGRERLCQVNEKICALEMMKRQLEYLVSHLEESAPTTCPVATQDARIASQNSSRQKRAHAADCPANPKSPRRK